MQFTHAMRFITATPSSCEKRQLGASTATNLKRYVKMAAAAAGINCFTSYLLIPTDECMRTLH